MLYLGLIVPVVGIVLLVMSIVGVAVQIMWLVMSKTSKNPKLKSWGCLTLPVIGVSGVLILVLGAVAVDPIVKATYSNRFAPYISQYVNLSGLTRSEGAAYLTGKLIMVDKDQRTIDEGLTYGFGAVYPDLVATTPEEVGTIIWIDCKEDVVGHYTSGSRAYQWTCQVTVIDKAKVAIVGQNTLAGEQPPDNKDCCQDWHGDRPFEGMKSYIDGLPRR